MRNTFFERDSRERSPRRRRGSVFPIFLISLVLVSATAAVLVRTTLAQRSLVRAEDRRIQADWLVHSAAARAAVKLHADSTYSGETWQLSAEQSGLSHPAAIEIVVSAVDEKAGRPDLGTEQHRQVDLTVNYPSQGEQKVRLSRRVFVKASAE